SEVAHKATPVIGAPDLYTFGTNRNEVRAIALENDGSKAEIPLRVTPENQGVFRFKAKGLDQLPYSHAVLEDRSTGKEYELHGKEMVQVRLSPSDSGNERFFLRLTDKDPTGIEKEPDEGEASIIIRTEGRALFFKKKGKPKVYRTSLHDATGQEVRSPEEVRLDASGVRWMNELSKGIYFVRLQGPQKSISKKVFIGGNR
ncbi:MAG: T9SS type A sorting domain-containing protein, partial [Flavobacteriales bacterium]